MKTPAILTLIILWSGLFCVTAQAEQIYLPVVTQNTLVEATPENADFQDKPTSATVQEPIQNR